MDIKWWFLVLFLFFTPKRYTYMITASWQPEFHSFCHFLQPVLIYRKCYHQYAKLQCKRNCCLWPCTIDPILHVWRLKTKPLEKLMSSITSGFWKLCITTRLWIPEAKSSSLGLIFLFGIPKNKDISGGYVFHPFPCGWNPWLALGSPWESSNKQSSERRNWRKLSPPSP